MRLKDKVVLALMGIFFVATPTGTFFLSKPWAAVILGLCSFAIAITLAQADD